MNKIKQQFTKLAAVGFLAGSALLVQAQPYYIAGDFNGWNNNLDTLTGGPTVYSFVITGGTPGAAEGFKILPTGGSWSPSHPNNNVWLKYDATGGNTVYFYPGLNPDGWQPVQNRVGYDDPGNVAFEIAGDFTTPAWDSDPTAQMVSAGSGLYTNTYVIATPGTHQFKFRSPGAWGNAQVGTDFGQNTGNGTVTTTIADEAVLFQLDLPNGRWVAGTPVPTLVTNPVVFVVDMTVEQGLGRFDPAIDQVFVSGSFNGWPATGAGALALTNVPTLNGNTNLYYGTNVFIYSSPSSYEYKFTDNNPALSGQGGYEPRSSNRNFTTLSANGELVLSPVVFGDAALGDYLDQDVMVTFTVDMAAAMTSINSPSAQNSPEGYTAHAFVAGVDSVVVNGNFLNGGWVSSWNPISLFGNVMTPIADGSTVYGFTYTVPKGSPVEIHYKYGIIYNDNPSTNNIVDNEAPSMQDHIRIVRSTVTGEYAMATDTFGNQHVEPSFGGLAIAPTAGGQVTLQWLGRPGVHLQSVAELPGSSWVDHLETDGTNWSAGSASPDGLLSETNLPAAGGSQYFRLVKP